MHTDDKKKQSNFCTQTSLENVFDRIRNRYYENRMLYKTEREKIIRRDWILQIRKRAKNNGDSIGEKFIFEDEFLPK